MVKNSRNNFDKKLSIVIACQRHDFEFTKICISSVRYYYPSIEILLLKDEKNGFFSTKKVEKLFDLKVVKLEKNIFGWGNSKILLVLSKLDNKKKYLVLDSDTIFVGPVLSNFNNILNKYDFIVSPETVNSPGDKFFNLLYYDPKWAKTQFSNFKYPGYAFNTGAMIISTKVIKNKDFHPYFSSNKYPFFIKKYQNFFQSNDQSLFNLLLPIFNDKKKIKLGLKPFMLWSEDNYLKNNISIESVKNDKNKILIHWAGYNKSASFSKLTRSDLLLFFLKQYYLKQKFGLLKYYLKIGLMFATNSN